ncbi:hypothetical protein DI396_02195 [Litorivita pollutaquae]|uniref:YjiS-like domain-containing protein n=1 Tax=Litorivita pollutaquae TaxID=2200892 RepID=A0A2V4NEY1_9RHOB|nr:DUF1127 domain-containing protein [Litorivita pollutaquae]OUS20653.1 hypothetical protein A9Q95_10095 [Rhodobacterales bacterium 59_46_T64]PYC48913.1 hypothetical protein DI396_02195 [Litorivita pollutaquae]
MAFSLPLPRRAQLASTGPKSAFVARLRNAMALSRQRRKLAALDNAALDDMGLTRTDVALEIRRSAWSAPDSWRG